MRDLVEVGCLGMVRQSRCSAIVLNLNRELFRHQSPPAAGVWTVTESGAATAAWTNRSIALDLASQRAG